MSKIRDGPAKAEFFSASSASSSRETLRWVSGVGSLYRGSECVGLSGSSWPTGMSGSFDTIQVLKNEIDKGVVFLGREDNEGEPAEPETERRLRQRHLLRPIPRLSAGPNDERGDRDGEEVIRLVENSAQQRGAGLSVAEPKHTGEVGKSTRQIRGAEEDPAE